MSIPFLVANYQTYNISYNRPTASSWSGTATYGSHSNDANAYDVVAGYEYTLNDTTATFCSLVCNARPRTSAGPANSTIIYSGFGTGPYNGSIYISTSGSVTANANVNGDVIEDGDVAIYFCTDWDGGTGGTWQNFAGYNNNGVEGTTSWTKDQKFAYTGAIADKATFAVKIVCSSSSSGSTLSTYANGSSNVDIYDIILT